MCTYVFWRKLCKCGHSEQLLTDPQGSDWLKAMLTLKVFSFFSSLHFPLLSLSWNNTSGKFLLHYFFFLSFGSSFIGKVFISVPVVHGTSCGILSVNMYLTLFRSFFCNESRDHCCTHGWADNYLSKSK